MPDEKWYPGKATIGSYIRTQRELSRLSLRELARMSQVSNAYLSQVERGIHEPSLRVLAAVAEALSAALKQSGQDMVVLGRLKSTERVAHFLAEIDTLYRQRAVSSGPLSLKMSRTEIADYLGLTIETVSRAIGKLKKRDVIGLMWSDEVVVLDNDKLRRIAKMGEGQEDPGRLEALRVPRL